MVERKFSGDSPDQIEQCLTCSRKECVNCLEYMPKGQYTIPVEQVDPNTGTVIAVYNSMTDAARAIGCAVNSIFGAVSGLQRTCRRYKWRKANAHKEEKS